MIWLSRELAATSIVLIMDEKDKRIGEEMKKKDKRRVRGLVATETTPHRLPETV